MCPVSSSPFSCLLCPISNTERLFARFHGYIKAEEEENWTALPQGLTSERLDICINAGEPGGGLEEHALIMEGETHL